MNKKNDMKTLIGNLNTKLNQQIVSVCSKKTYKFNIDDINGSLYLTPNNLLKSLKILQKMGL